MRHLTFAERASGASQALRAQRSFTRHEHASADQDAALARVAALADDAFQSVPLYRDRYGAVGFEPGAVRSWADFECLPIMDKRDFVEAGEAAVRIDLDRRHRLGSLTSGSSGTCLTVWHDARALGRIGLAILRVASMTFPVRPWHRTLYVYTSRFPVGSVFGAYPFTFVSTLDRPERIADVWRRTDPDIVWIYPSRLRDLLDELGTLPPTRFVSVNSEPSTCAERRSWELRLAAPVRDQYGSEELGIIAAECADRTLHVFDDLCHLEILDDNDNRTVAGEVGAVVGTNLDNRAMPFIRYRQGDSAVLAASACRCGRRLPTLTSLQGRGRGDLVGAEGQRVGSGVVIDALYELVLDLQLPLDGYQLVEGRPHQLLLEGPIGAVEVQRAVRHLVARTGLEVVGRSVDRIPVPASGKREVIWWSDQAATAAK